MTIDPRTPVLVGVGQVTHHAAGLDDALAPVELMARAVEAASADAGLSAVPSPDAVRVVSLLSWRYRDPARFVAERLGIEPHERAYSTGGGNSPQSLVNLTAGEILRGELDLAVITGAESWRTRNRAAKAGVALTELGWPEVDESVEPDRLIGEPLDMNHPTEQALGIVMPIQVYPMFETAIRAAAGETVDEHQVKVSELWSRFSQVASDNPYAWTPTARTAEEIRTPGPSNRTIGFPYTKYMNSNNDVDQGAAIIMCSVERARSLGVPEDRWVFVHAGSDCHEHTYISHRWTFAETPAIARGGRAALELAGIGIDDIAVVDLYSCFPSAVQLGARSLGLGLDGQLTRTGGLSFAGGPWNNYVMHGIASVVTDLRARPGELGLVWANGGYCTKHAFGVYSTTPPTSPFRHAYPQDEIDAMPRRELAEPADAIEAGEVTIEAYSVMHDREGAPEVVTAACLLADGRRAWALGRERELAAAMVEGEWVGRRATIGDGSSLLIG